ncbi:VRR-NUC domain-containing protein [Sorangium sp. So ce834]|uniref:VRR-NUC domain-containing protein n=1 Tax=Sorangium sp. So ce834 TaxID=3133321 RepID=UPI003F61F2DC
MQREILVGLGREHDVWVHPNVVGEGFHGAVYGQLMRELDGAARENVMRVLTRSRLTYGLGVGSPDLLLSVGGRIGWLELKREGGGGASAGRVSEEQARWHEAARRRGMLVEVVRSVEEAMVFVQALRGAG